MRACAGSKQEAGLGVQVGDPGPARAALQPLVTEVGGDISAAADSRTMLCAHARVLGQVVLVLVLRIPRLVGDSGPYARGCRRTWEPRFPLIQGWACLMLDMRNTLGSQLQIRVPGGEGLCHCPYTLEQVFE